MAKNTVVEKPQTAVMVMSWRELISVIAIGAVAGLLTYALYFMFEHYVFTPTLCSNSMTNIGKCENVPALSNGFATIVAALVALFALVRQRTYRPLLVVLGVTIGLWNMIALVIGAPWIIALIAMVVVFAIAYAAFAWLSQIRSFVISLLIVIALVALLRVIVY